MSHYIYEPSVPTHCGAFSATDPLALSDFALNHNTFLKTASPSHSILNDLHIQVGIFPVG